MRKIIYLICSFFAVFFVSCESNEPGSESPTYKPFSVSNTRTVIFSPGNLQYHPVNNEWRFAPSQLDYIGYENKNISSTYNGWIDLFGWGTAKNPTIASKNNDDYTTFVDWGINKIGNESPNTWRTLTMQEVEYIINVRTNASNLIGVAQVDTIVGLVLLPDNWTCPNGIIFKPGFNESLNALGRKYYGEHQTFSLSDWKKLEESGAVFLPAAGDRYKTGISSVQYYGNYHVTTEYNTICTYNLFFSSQKAALYYGFRGDGLSVRLVRDFKE